MFILYIQDAHSLIVLLFTLPSLIYCVTVCSELSLNASILKYSDHFNFYTLVLCVVDLMLNGQNSS